MVRNQAGHIRFINSSSTYKVANIKMNRTLRSRIVLNADVMNGQQTCRLSISTNLISNANQVSQQVRAVSSFLVKGIEMYMITNQP